MCISHPRQDQLMRSPKKGRAPRLTLADLKPAEQITCFMCNQPKPAADSKPFRAHQVCRECVQKVAGK